MLNAEHNMVPIKRWSKPFDPSQPLVAYLGESAFRFMSPATREFGRDWEKAFAGVASVTKLIINTVVFNVEEMRKRHFSPILKWANKTGYQSIFEFFDEIEGAWGIDANFYVNSEFEKVY